MNIKVYDFIKSPLIILVGVLLFIITYNIKEENFIDKIMIPFALFVSILIILGGLIMLSPFKRKISKNIKYAYNEKNELSNSKFLQNSNHFLSAFKKAIVYCIPVGFTFFLFYLIGYWGNWGYSILTFLITSIAIYLIVFITIKKLKR
jgi:hypothetical protein